MAEQTTSGVAWRFTLERADSAGVWHPAGLLEMAEEEANLTILMLAGIYRAHASGRLTIEQAERMATGWLKVDHRSFTRLSSIERAAVLFALGPAEPAPASNASLH